MTFIVKTLFINTIQSQFFTIQKVILEKASIRKFGNVKNTSKNSAIRLKSKQYNEINATDIKNRVGYNEQYKYKGEDYMLDIPGEKDHYNQFTGNSGVDNEHILINNEKDQT